MIRIYLNAALRTLIREKGNTFINIAGLTLGIATTLILFLIVHNGKSYDTYHTHFDRIYRVVSSGQGNSGITYTEGVPAALPEAFKADFTGVEEVVFTSYKRHSLIVIPQQDGSVKKYEEPQGLVFTEPSFFRIFDRALISGRAETSLDDPREAVISRKWARKYFGTEDAVGRSVVYDSIEYSIRAVMEDYPTTTDLPFDLMLSYNTIRKEMDAGGWGSISDNDNCYVLLRDNGTARQIEALMPWFVKKHRGEDNGKEGSFILQPMKDVHSDTRFNNYNKKMPMLAQVTFTVVAVFMLLTACINFINLSTAQAIRRTREVGIRKALGSSRAQLVFQLVGEAFMTTTLATLVSMSLVPVVLTFINPFLGLSLSLNLSEPAIAIALLTLVVVVTLLAGLYPALVVSGFRPVLALKNQTGAGVSSGYTLRRALVVFQFFISQLFIFGTIAMTKQMEYMQHQDLGFSKDAVITLPVPVQETAGSPGNMRTLKNELLRYSGIRQVSLNYAPPTARTVMSTGLSMAEQENEISVQLKQVDSAYIGLFDIDIIAGENLPDRDTLSAVVVNERLARLAGFDDARKIVGEDVLLWGKRYPVKGVVKDFHTQTLERAIEPVVLYSDRSAYKSIAVKISTTAIQATLDHVKGKWEKTYPEYSFNYAFMDQQIADMYRGERKTAAMLNVFSVIVILIGCLGLLGLVTYMTNQRTKEMGIRKVLGASVTGIMMLFGKEFVRLIIVGFLLAAPLAGLVMQEVLQEFAYRIKLGPGLFLAGLGITLVVAFLTVGYSSFRASSANPVASLRRE